MGGRLRHGEGGSGGTHHRGVHPLVRWQDRAHDDEVARFWPPTASVSLWLPAVLFAAVAPLLSGMWWTGAVYAPGVPAARPDRGVLSVVVAMLLIAVATIVVLRWMRARVPGVLGGWLAAIVASGLVGLVQAIVVFATDGGLAGDLWPLMAAYVTVADGLSFG